MVWEEGVRVGWEVYARDWGGSGSRLVYIAGLYDAGEGAINLAPTMHKFDQHLYI